MEYFLSHLPYIIAAGVCIALVSIVWAFFLNVDRREESDIASEDKVVSCAGCALAGLCSMKGPEECGDKRQATREQEA